MIDILPSALTGLATVASELLHPSHFVLASFTVVVVSVVIGSIEVRTNGSDSPNLTPIIIFGLAGTASSLLLVGEYPLAVVGAVQSFNPSMFSITISSLTALTVAVVLESIRTQRIHL